MGEETEHGKGPGDVSVKYQQETASLCVYLVRILKKKKIRSQAEHVVLELWKLRYEDGAFEAFLS